MDMADMTIETITGEPSPLSFATNATIVNAATLLQVGRS